MNAPDKKSLRRLYRALRAAMPEAEHAAASEAICARLLTLPELQRARTVHAFWPSMVRREVDLRPLLTHLHAQGVRVVLPRVLPGAERSMAHVAWDGGPLHVGAFDLEEPPPGAEVPPAGLDVVLVPALAADRIGTRLGYGKGFYDAFLARTPAYRIVPLLEACLADCLPAEPHDIPAQLIVTEARILRLPDLATGTGA